MDTLQSEKASKKIKLIWTLPYIAILVGLFFVFMGLSEFYNVKFGGQKSAYPFGPINDNPWFYQTASIYSTYNLVTGIIFSIATSLTLWATLKRNKKSLIIGVCMTVLFLLGDFISQRIQ